MAWMLVHSLPAELKALLLPGSRRVVSSMALQLDWLLMALAMAQLSMAPMKVLMWALSL